MTINEQIIGIYAAHDPAAAACDTEIACDRETERACVITRSLSWNWRNQNQTVHTRPEEDVRYTPSVHARRSEAATVRRAIDAALLAGTAQPLRDLPALHETISMPALIDKIRRRATQLSRRERAQRASLIRARDAIILALYARAAPTGWMTAWCDGSTKAADTKYFTGIGGILADRDGHIVARIARELPGGSALEAEIAAAGAVLSLALDSGITRVRLHTDCKALLDLWLNRRGDPRLAELHAQAARLDRLQIRLIPRAHNQAAHRLAYAAVRSAGTTHLAGST